MYKIVAVRWRIQPQIAFFWYIENDVFQMPQLQKHVHAGRMM